MSWELGQWQRHYVVYTKKVNSALKNSWGMTTICFDICLHCPCPQVTKLQLSQNQNREGLLLGENQFLTKKNRWFSGSETLTVTQRLSHLCYILTAWCVPTSLTITAVFTKHLHELLVELVGVWLTNLFSIWRPCFRPFSLSCSSKHQDDFLVSAGHHNV